MGYCLVLGCTPTPHGFSLEMDSSFKQHLKEIAPFLLSQNRLVVKTINGTPLTGKTLYDIFGVSSVL